MSRKKIDAHTSKIISEDESTTVEPTIIDEYKELNDKCDSVITRIKKRKNSSSIKAVSNG
jgi:hypothetical protein